LKEDGSGMNGSPGWQDAFGKASTKLQEPITKQEGGKSFEELWEDAGGADTLIVLKSPKW
jgi:hypothetical protein